MVDEGSNQEPSQEEAEVAQSQGNAKKKTAKKTIKKAAVKKKATRKSRAKKSKEVRLKAFWGVFSQSLNPVLMFEYGQRKEAQKRAEELSQSRKSPHFVQLVKKVIEE